MQLVLCSTSASRKMLLERLQIPFTILTPDIDETPKSNESPILLVKRLALAKASVHKQRFPKALLIGSDQVAMLENEIVSKPENHAEAVRQLTRSSGKTIKFYTGLCLYNTATEKYQLTVEKFTVVYRTLTQDMIENYLQKEKPYHCAGSIKAEGLGIGLLKRVSGNDPTALTGLPLIKLVTMLYKEGVNII